MIRILLANEFGSGRGHIVTLKSVAEALGMAFAFEAALAQLNHEDELSACCHEVYQASGLDCDTSRRSGPDAVITATWGEYLGDLGFARPDFLKDHILWWRDLIASDGYDLVVGECAPGALLAARSLGIPAVAIGPGHSVPPDELKAFPLFMPENGQLLYDERDLTANVNAILEPLGVPALQTFPEIYACADKIVRTIDLLDPYRGLRTRPYVPPVVDLGDGLADAGDEVFVYFSDVAAQPACLNKALCDLGLPVRAFIPGLEAEEAQRLSNGGVKVEPRAVPVEDIIRRSRMMVHYGMHGTTCLGLAAGLPQLTLPQQVEQLNNGRRVAERDAARVLMPQDWTVAHIQAAIHAVYSDATMATAARALSIEARPHLAADGRLAIRERLRPIVVDIFKAKGLA